MRLSTSMATLSRVSLIAGFVAALLSLPGARYAFAQMGARPAGVPVRATGSATASHAAIGSAQIAAGIAQMMALPQAATPNPWTPIGPTGLSNSLGLGSLGYCGARPVANASGRATAIGFGAASGTVYLGTAGGGVWKSTDGGSTWSPLTDFQPALAIGALKVLPGANAGQDVIYAGTGEGNQAGDNMYGDGVLVSRDSGNTWTQLGASTFAGQTFGDLAVVPGQGGNPTIIYGATQQGRASSSTSIDYVPPVTAGVYRSADGGVSWTMLSGSGGLPAGGQTDGSAADIVVDPSTLGNPLASQTVYAAIKCTSDCDNGGLYKSVDGGSDWEQLTNGLPTETSNMKVFVSNDGKTIYVAAAGTGDDFAGVFISNDSGADFHPGGALPQVGSSTDCLDQGQASYNLAIAADPNNLSNVYVGLIGLYKSSDGGNTWSFATSTTSTGFHADFHFAIFNGGTIWATNDGGVTFSSDGGTTWNNSANLGLTTFQAQSVSLAPSGVSVALTGGQDNGVNVYKGQPAWTNSQQYGDGGITAIDPLNTQIMFGTAFQFFLGRSSNGLQPNSLVDIDPTVPQGEGVQFYAPYILDPSNPDRLVFGTNRIWQTCALSPQVTCDATTGNPPSWNVISPPLNPGCSVTTEDGTKNSCNVTGVAIAPGNPAVLYAVTAGNDGIGPFAWVSNNSNTATPSFTNITAGLPTGGSGFTSVSVAPGNPSTALVSVQGVTGGGGHIFRTTNGGTSWTDITGAGTGYPDVPTQKVLYDPYDQSGNTIYAGTSFGILVSSDGGATWQNFNGTTLPNVQVLDIQRNSTHIAVATHGRSDWVMSAPVATVTSAPVNNSGHPGQTVSGGTFTITNPGTGTANVASVTLSVSRPSIFSSMTLSGGGQSASVSPPVASSTFTFTTPVSIAAGASVTFDLSGVIAGHTAMAESRVRYAGITPIPFSRLRPLETSLLLIGFALLAIPAGGRRRAVIGATLLVALAVSQVGCGGSSSGGGSPAPAASSSQQVTMVGIPAAGLPANLGTIKSH